MLQVGDNDFDGNILSASGEWDLLYYESNDCTGILYIHERVSALTPVVVHPPGDGGNIVYIPEPSSLHQVVSFNSRRGYPNGACTADSFPAWVYPAIPLIDLDTVFTPPFTVRD